MVFPVTDLVVSFSGRAGVYRPRAKNPTPRPRRAGCGLRGRLGSVHARQQGGNSSTCPSPDRGPTARLLRARPASSRAHARFGSIQISKTERERERGETGKKKNPLHANMHSGPLQTVAWGAAGHHRVRVLSRLSWMMVVGAAGNGAFAPRPSVLRLIRYARRIRAWLLAFRFAVATPRQWQWAVGWTRPFFFFFFFLPFFFVGGFFSLRISGVRYMPCDVTY